MALAKNIMILIFSMMIIVFKKSNGETYKVGDSAGWTSTGHVDYKTWAATKTFRVGDKILGLRNCTLAAFEYNKQFYNVVRVTHKNFNSCNATDPFATMSSGNDTFVIAIPGHYYFICGFPGHCEAGQKVDIRVLPTPSSPSQSPVPVSPNPWSPSEPTPSPPSPWPFTPSPSPTDSSSGAYQESQKSNFVWSISILVSVAFGIGR